MKVTDTDKNIAKAIDSANGEADDHLIRLSTGVVLKAKNASFEKPDGQLLRLNDVVLSYENSFFLVHISGQPGAGKTSLVKFLCGQIPCSTGEIHFNEDYVVCPQIPYVLSVGNVFDQLRYPDEKADEDLVEMAELLRFMQVDHLMYRQNASFADDPKQYDWQHQLSPGEKQKLSIARMMWHLRGKRRIVVLDEAMNSLDEDTERRVMERLKQLKCFVFLVFIRILASLVFAVFSMI